MRPISQRAKRWYAILWIVGLVCASAAGISNVHAQATANSSSDESGLNEVIVTARKVSESALDVPESITAFSEQALQTFNIQTFDDYAIKVPNLGFSYGTGSLGFSASRTIAIRGISGSGTTALYIDDTPVFDSMDPRVVDVERIEVLKGPQGTLFGEGSLGGTVRLVTRQPEFNDYSLDYSGEVGTTWRGDSPDGGLNLVGNAGLIPDRLAVRALAFYDHTPGFIVREFPDTSSPSGETSVNDQGARTDFGGSLSFLFKILDQFDATVRILYQNTQYTGLPVGYAPLPAFVPTLIQNRTANIQEGATDRWYLPSLQLNYKGEGFDVVSATTYFWRYTNDIENGTEGTYQAAETFFGFNAPPQPDPWYLNSTSDRFTQETRVSFDKIHGVSGTIGLYYSRTSNDTVFPPNYLPGLAAAGFFPTDLDWSATGLSTTSEKAIFGEIYVDLPYSSTLTLGARQYWLNQHIYMVADGIFNGGPSEAANSNAESGVSPKFALEHKFDPDLAAYISAAKGFRAGGAGGQLPEFCASGLAAIGLTPESASRFNPDTVWNYEVGAKSQLLDHQLFVTGALFQQEWQDIQQVLFIPSCGFTFQGNAGAARSRGAELEASGRLLPPLTIHIGLGYDDARITSAGASGEAVGSRVRETPELTETAGFEYAHPLTTTFDGFISGDVSHVGDSLSSISSASSILVRPPYTLVDGRLGVRWGKSEIALFLKNLTNAKPNLGDLNPISYSRYVLNSEGVPTILPRVSTVEPFMFGIQFRGSF
jgi:iron complex outermembrane recepter protein